MTFGVLTTNSVEEALERAGEGPSNKGWEAAAAAIEMAARRRGSCAPGRSDAQSDERRSRTDPRHRAREAALQILYQWEIGAARDVEQRGATRSSRSSGRTPRPRRRTCRDVCAPSWRATRCDRLARDRSR